MKKAEILTCETDAKRKIADKSHRMVELAVNTEDAYALTEPKRRSAPARYEVVNFLATAGRTPAAEVSYYTGEGGTDRLFRGGGAAGAVLGRCGAGAGDRFERRTAAGF